MSGAVAKQRSRTPDRSTKKTAPVAQNLRTSVTPNTTRAPARGPALPLAVQTKVAIGQVDDPYEREADAVADQVVQGASVPDVSSIPVGGLGQTPQRMEDEQVQTLALQRMDDEPVQAKSEAAPSAGDLLQTSEASTGSTVGSSGSSGAVSSPAVAADRAITTRGAGSPMYAGTQRRLESSMGVDLSDVRVHQDAASHQSNRDLNSRAFAHSNHIWLGRGQSQNDVGLMAHESTHVLQQGGVVRRQPLDNVDDAATSLVATSMAPVSASATLSSPVADPATSLPAANSPAAVTTIAAVPVQAQEVPAEEPEIVAGAGVVADANGDSATAGSEDATSESTDVTGVDAEGGDVVAGDSSTPILMSEPPSDLSSGEQARITEVESNAGAANAATIVLPTASESANEARGAVTEPEEETSARAENALVEALGIRPEPSPEIEELCANIYRVIRSKRPADEDALVSADPTAMATAAGEQLNDSIEGDTDRVGSDYDELGETQEGTPQQVGQEMQNPPESVSTPGLNARSATPDGVEPGAVDLGPDVEANRQRMTDAGMDTTVAQEIQDPSNPVVAGRDAQAGLEEVAEQDPAIMLAEQQTVLANTNTDMAAMQVQAFQALANSRRQTVAETTGQQTEMVGSEEEMRTQASNRANAIFLEAQTGVQAQLATLSEDAMSKWRAGVQVLSTEFEQKLKRVEDWIDERHSGGWGSVVGVWDSVTGLPDWVTEEYDEAEQAFGDGVCELIREISTYVNGIVAVCEAIIEDSRTRIATVFSELPTELQGWATEQQAGLSQQLDGLQQETRDTRDNFNQEIIQNASQAVDDVRVKIQGLREAAGGLIGAIVNAVQSFIDDPVKFIIEGLLKLVGIAPSAFWALVNRIGDAIESIADDPLNFANNLMQAIGEGFTKFFDNVSNHLLNGLLEWLFSGLGSVGVTIPSDFSLKSVITFFLELMGITWDRIRGLLARHLGEENIALIEQAYDLVSTLIEMGPEGIFELIKEQLNPQNILNMVLEAAVDFLVEGLVTAVTPRIIALFNPAGAIVQAVEAIYRVLSWLFENAARIFSLIETVVNGITDIIAGNVGGMATAIETALSGLISPVIDFLAGYLGLGDLPEKIADTIRGFQEWIEGILDRVIGWLAGRARALLSAITGPADDSEAEAESDEPTVSGSDTQPNVSVPFSMSGEGHTLYLGPEESGGDVEVEMASDKRLPLFNKFKKAHTRLDNLRRYIAALEDEAVKELYQDEFGDALSDLPENIVQRFNALYQQYFPKGREADLSEDEKRRAKQKVNTLIAEANSLVSKIAKWGDDYGIGGLSSEEIDGVVQAKGRELWNQAYSSVRDQIDTVLAGHNFHGAPVSMRGSVRTGWRGDPKGTTRFNESDFDVDMYVVDAEVYDSAVNRGVAVQYGKIFPTRSLPELLALSNQVRSELTGAFPTIRRVASSEIVLRRREP